MFASSEDQIETAARIRKAVEELNAALRDGRMVGLTVNLETVPLRNIGQPDSYFVRTTVYKEV